MAVKMQEDYRIGDYVGTFGLVCSACDDFLQSLEDDIDYKRVSDLHGMVVIATNKDRDKISFIVNDVRFDYRDGRLYFNDYMDALYERPYILHLVISTFNEMLLHSDVEISNKNCIQNCVTAFLMLQGWFEDKRISDLEYEIEERDRRQAARENAEFWDEYYFFNPNDV